MMLVYSVIYLLLAVYVERVNPGEFGISQPWNYLFKKSFWKPYASGAVQPMDSHERKGSRYDIVDSSNSWIEFNSIMDVKKPSLSISHLTKVRQSVLFFYL
jgi:hypothetical protein